MFSLMCIGPGDFSDAEYGLRVDECGSFPDRPGLYLLCSVLLCCDEKGC